MLLSGVVGSYWGIFILELRRREKLGWEVWCCSEKYRYVEGGLECVNNFGMVEVGWW